MAVIYGVDVSSYQGAVNWRSVWNAGIRFGFSKVTQGTGYLNPTWHHNLAGMTALGSGFVPGAYHFLTAGNGAGQARYFVQAVGGAAKCRQLAIALDVEPTTGSRPSAADARAWVAEFRKLVPGHPVVGYVPGWYHAEIGRPSLTFLDTLWQSNYVTGRGSPSALYSKAGQARWAGYGGRSVSVLQFSSTGRVASVSGDCDVNAYRGTAAQLRALVLAGSQEDDLPAPKDVWSYSIPKSKDFDQEWQAATHLRHATVQLGQILAGQAAIAKKQGVDVDESAIVAGILAALTPATIAAAVADALPEDLARQVVDELGNRLASS